MKRVSIIAIAIAIAVAGAGCTKKNAASDGKKRQSMKFPVEVQTVEIADVQYSVESVGSVEAFEQVAVTARVAGAVDRVKFTEGSRVSAGQEMARCGNSGNSTEPHLHLQAISRLDVHRASAVPITLRGELPRNGEIVHPR